MLGNWRYLRMLDPMAGNSRRRSRRDVQRIESAWPEAIPRDDAAPENSAGCATIDPVPGFGLALGGRMGRGRGGEFWRFGRPASVWRGSPTEWSMGRLALIGVDWRRHRIGANIWWLVGGRPAEAVSRIMHLGQPSDRLGGGSSQLSPPS